MMLRNCRPIPLLGTDIDRFNEDTLDIKFSLIDRICCLRNFIQAIQVSFTIKIGTDLPVNEGDVVISGP